MYLNLLHQNKNFYRSAAILVSLHQDSSSRAIWAQNKSLGAFVRVA